MNHTAFFSRSLKSLLRQQEYGQAVLQQAKTLRAITRSLQYQIPEHMRAHCQAGFLDAQSLILVVDSPAWATQLRYLAPALKQKLIQSGLLNEQQSLRIKVRPAQTSSVHKSDLPAPLRMSRNNAALLKDTAAGMADDELKNALLKLSRHVK